MVEPFAYHDRHILEAWSKGESPEAVVDFLLRGGVDDSAYYRRAWQRSLNQLQRLEQGMDLVVSDYFEKYGCRRRLFHTPHQPTQQVIIRLAHSIVRKVLGRGIEICEISEEAEHTRYPIYQNAVDALGFEFESNPRIYRLKGQSKSVEEMVAGYFRFYDQHRSLAEFNHESILRLKTKEESVPTNVHFHASLKMNAEIKPIHSSQSIVFKKPQSFGGRPILHPRLRLDNGVWPETSVYRIPNGQACLSPSPKFFDREGKLILDLYGDQESANEPMLSKTAMTHFKGKVCPLILRGSGIYAHWLGDVLPSLHLVELAGISLDTIDNFIFLRTNQN